MNKKYLNIHLLAGSLILPLLSSGCGLLLGGDQRVDNKSHNYTVVRLDHNTSLGNWQYKPKPSSESEFQEPGFEEIADLAFVEKDTGSIISLNSVCRNYQDRPLKQLMNTLLMGISRTSEIQYSQTNIDQSNALSAVFETTQQDARAPAKFDSRFKIKAVVLNKEKCSFDFMLISEKKYFKKSEEVFDHFLRGFHVD